MTHTSSQRQSTQSNARLLDVQQVAEILGCSTRHVFRLSDSGKMPRPVKLGALVRWNRSAIEDWITGNCQSVRASKRHVN